MNKDNTNLEYDHLSEQEKEAILNDWFPNMTEDEIADQLEGEWGDD